MGRAAPLMLAAWVAAWVAAGCGARTGARVPDASRDAGPADAGMDAGRPEGGVDGGVDASVDGGGECDAGPVVLDAGGEELVVDLLFVVDNSRSMSEEQRALAAQFPMLVRTLATGDLDGDGRADFEPVSDLQVGVITTELAIGPWEIGGCAVEPAEGDDGVLRTLPRFGSRGECDREYPPFLRYRPGEDDPGRLAHDFGCTALVGTQGCGIEQPLEAALKALTPAESELEFLDGTGHADGANAGFLREGSILTVVIVTDENDCSIRDPELMNPDSEIYTDPDPMNPNRCFHYQEEALHPIGRYVDAFRELREDPDGLVFAAIAGIPDDVATDPDEIDYDALLDDPRMVEEIDPDMPRRLRPACDVVGTGFATPSRRIVEVARGLRRVSVVQSVCQDDLSGALSGLTRRLARVIRRRRCR